jgi:hypothetical protein
MIKQTMTYPETINGTMISNYFAYSLNVPEIIAPSKTPTKIPIIASDIPKAPCSANTTGLACTPGQMSNSSYQMIKLSLRWYKII